MILKGIAKGDKDLRHFTFNDEEYIERDGVYYYKVNYGKNKLEGPDAEDEIGYVAADKVMALGGRKPKPIPGKEPEIKPVVAETPVNEAKVKKPRTAKTTKLSPSTETFEVSTGPGIFEYKVEQVHASKIKELEKQLNLFGQEGWEVCGMDSNKSLFGEIQMVVIMKRKRG